MKKLILLLLISSTSCLHAATITAITNGNWNLPSTWSGNVVPAASDIAIIPAGIKVTYFQNDQDIIIYWDNPASIKVYGTLELQGKSLWFNNPTILEFFSGGRLLENTSLNMLYFNPVSKYILHRGSEHKSAYWTDFKIANKPISFTSIYTGGPLTLTINESKINISLTVVPLHLISFSAHELSKGIELNWNTANEENTAGFEIERSADGKYFQSIGNVPAKSFSANKYTYMDHTPLAGINFYRLKMMDIDNSHTYSEVVKISPKPVLNKINIYPVPAQNSIHITTVEKGVASVFSSGGRLVKMITLSAGNTNVDISTLSNGLYYCVFNGNKLTFIKSGGN